MVWAEDWATGVSACRGRGWRAGGSARRRELGTGEDRTKDLFGSFRARWVRRSMEPLIGWGSAELQDGEQVEGKLPSWPPLRQYRKDGAKAMVVTACVTCVFGVLFALCVPLISRKTVKATRTLLDWMETHQSFYCIRRLSLKGASLLSLEVFKQTLGHHPGLFSRVMHQKESQTSRVHPIHGILRVDEHGVLGDGDWEEDAQLKKKLVKSFTTQQPGPHSV